MVLSVVQEKEDDDEDDDDGDARVTGKDGWRRRRLRARVSNCSRKSALRVLAPNRRN